MRRLDVFSFFFFSSRRRHTRSDRDWSSDVCSSDLWFSERMFKSRITLWKFNKRVKAREREEIIHEWNRRRLQGEDCPVIFVHGRQIDQHKIDRYLRDQAKAVAAPPLQQKCDLSESQRVTSGMGMWLRIEQHLEHMASFQTGRATPPLLARFVTAPLLDI